MDSMIFYNTQNVFIRYTQIDSIVKVIIAQCFTETGIDIIFLFSRGPQIFSELKPRSQEIL
jgi:hypothetical protein